MTTGLPHIPGQRRRPRHATVPYIKWNVDMTQHFVDPAADDPDPVARQLMHQAQLIARLRSDLDQLAHDATDTIAGLIARLEDLETLLRRGTR